MDELIRTISCCEDSSKQPENLLSREWLVTNGLGGYASGTIANINTRRYHGILVAALHSPFGRMIMLDQLVETLHFPDGTNVRLTGEERTSCELQMHGNCYLTEFSLEYGLPVWHYQFYGIHLEKRLFMRHKQNTVQITYKLLFGNTGIMMELHPNVHFRSHHDPVDIPLRSTYTITAAQDHFILSVGRDLPPLRMLFYGGGISFTVGGARIEEHIYREEASRGFPGRSDLWDPGSFQITLEPRQEFTFVASTESMETIKALSPQEAVEAEKERRGLLLEAAPLNARQELATELIFAADQFIITPAGRYEDTVIIQASGGEIRTVIAGYHWFTDWGRDTMISLEGLTLLTGRYPEARWILHTFTRYIHNGIIPNMFPEGEKQGLYNTADATLWYFHALDRYMEYTNDRTTLRLILPKLLKIIDHHLRGTDFHIGIDPKDGLLRQGQQGYALTWMDAKVDDWVVTPRRGKAVEINALWYNALRLTELWVREEMGDSGAKFLSEQAELTRESFNKRFWHPEGGYLFDVVDGEQGDDVSCRPNQIFAISPRFPVLNREHWESVMDVVTKKLLTPVGLRSLSGDSPDYKLKYLGELQARDAAYHQGTVWAWLIGPYIDAWLKINPNNKTEARQFLDGLITHLNEACIGSISEIFDANEPFTPRGCIAQAWSVAEVLRCWLQTSPV